MFKKLKQKLCDEKTGKLKTNVIVTVGIIGILLIFISGLDFGENDDNSDMPDTPAAYDRSSETESYRAAQEQRLCDILSGISGAGTVEVMISLEGTAEYIYLQKTESKQDSDESGSKYEIKSEPVMIGSSSPIIVKSVSPKITGVLIVADGAGSPVLDEKLINAAAAALGISTANICVAQRAR